MCCLERDLRRGRELPWGSVGFEYVSFGVLGGEEVVVARLAARATGGVCHLGSRHRGIDVRIRLWLAREEIACSVRLIGKCLWRVEAGKGSLGGHAVLREALSGAYRIVSVSRVGPSGVLRHCTKVVAWSASMRDVCLALGRLRSSVRRECGTAGSRVAAGDGVPASGHDGGLEEMRGRLRLPGMNPTLDGGVK